MMICPDPSRVLIIQLRRIGDVILCTPVIKALKEQRPDLHITFLTESESESILRNNPLVDELIIWDKGRYKNPAYLFKSLRGLKRKKFDTVIDLQGSGRTALASFLSGASTRIGFNYQGRSLFYSIQVKRDDTPKYGSAFKIDILAPFGIFSNDLKPTIFLTPPAIDWRERFFAKYQIGNSPLRISVSPVSRRPYKRWPVEQYARICAWLIQKFKAKVILVWGPGEKSIVEKVAELSGSGVIVSDPTEDLLELAALIEGCDMHLGNDNGIKHIATAVGTPTFTIFGPSDPISWTFPDPRNHRYIKGICRCLGRQKNSCEGPACLASVSAADVQESLSPFVEEIIARKVSSKVAQA